MPSRAIKPKKDDEPVSGKGWQGLAEQAPSLVRPEQPTTARVVALVGLFPLVLGAAALFCYLIEKPYLISLSWGIVLFVLGVGALLYHAFVEKDLQYRRLYGAVGAAALGLAVVFLLVPAKVPGAERQTDPDKQTEARTEMGALFLPGGAPCLLLAIGFLGAFARNETDQKLRRMTLGVIGVAGVLTALLGLAGGALSDNFMLGKGVVLLAVGLLYLGAYIGLEGAGSDSGHLAGLGIGLLGGLMLAVALAFSFGPYLLYWLNLSDALPSQPFFMPRGLLLLYFGLEYVLLSLAICSDNRLVVLTRRELAAFFYSPIAYVLLIGVTVLGWCFFREFIDALLDPRRPVGVPEPIVRFFTTDYFQVFSVVFIVPLLTMRLLSEERRTGSLEVLLTAPVNETPVVLSKFFAALRVFLLIWYSWGFFLLALRVEGGEEFDYRPLLTFFISLSFMGAGWLAMGLFFSSLTRNQIASAIMTLVAMIVLTMIFWFKRGLPEGTVWFNVLQYVSYVDL
ncbi:MAG TPA: ABC transporter permease, partial [Gemmataceae bacterium]|nr:ABC transporter permease [Gemmataceae bacterium]